MKDNTSQKTEEVAIPFHQGKNRRPVSRGRRVQSGSAYEPPMTSWSIRAHAGGLIACVYKQCSISSCRHLLVSKSTDYSKVPPHQPSSPTQITSTPIALQTTTSSSTSTHQKMGLFNKKKSAGDSSKLEAGAPANQDRRRSSVQEFAERKLSVWSNKDGRTGEGEAAPRRSSRIAKTQATQAALMGGK
jgi:hypothetical protein